MNKHLKEIKSTIENQNTLKKIVILFFGLFFLSDFLTKASITYGDSSFRRLAGIVKLGFEFFIIIFILKKRKMNQALILGATLLVAFLISNISLLIINKEHIDYNKVIKNIYYVNRYLYIFIFIAFLQLYEVSFSRKDNFIKLFKTVLYLNSILIIIGLMFKMELFRSYSFTSRFGYSGIFSKHGEAAYYYMFFLSILFYEYHLTNRPINKLLKIIAISLVSILLGKKAIILFLLLLLLTHVALVLRKGKQVAVIILTFITGLFFFIETILEEVFKLSPFWEVIYKNHDLIGALTSTRSKLFVNFINYFVPNWNVLNYLFGIGEYETHKVEFEFVDVFLFFGFTGVFVFVYFFKKYFYNKTNIISTCLLMSILLTSFFSGALFISVTCMMFFYMVFEWINSRERSYI